MNYTLKFTSVTLQQEHIIHPMLRILLDHNWAVGLLAHLTKHWFLLGGNKFWIRSEIDCLIFNANSNFYWVNKINMMHCTWSLFYVSYSHLEKLPCLHYIYILNKVLEEHSVYIIDQNANEYMLDRMINSILLIKISCLLHIGLGSVNKILVQLVILQDG